MIEPTPHPDDRRAAQRAAAPVSERELLLERIRDLEAFKRSAEKSSLRAREGEIAQRERADVLTRALAQTEDALYEIREHAQVLKERLEPIMVDTTGPIVNFENGVGHAYNAAHVIAQVADVAHARTTKAAKDALVAAATDVLAPA